MYTCEECEFMIEDYCKDRDFVLYNDVIELFGAALEVDFRKILIDGKSDYLYKYVGKMEGKQVGTITNRYRSIKVIEKIVKDFEKVQGFKMLTHEKYEFVDLLKQLMEVKYK